MSVTAILHSRRDTIEEASDHVGRIIIHMTEASGHATLLYNVSAQAEDVRCYSSVDFLVIVPVNANVDLTTSNGDIRMQGVEATVNAETSNGVISIDGLP